MDSSVPSRLNRGVGPVAMIACGLLALTVELSEYKALPVGVEVSGPEVKSAALVALYNTLFSPACTLTDLVQYDLSKS